jgi:hypothetical protein
MKLGRLSALTSAALLAAGVSVAMAQSTTAPSTSNSPAAAGSPSGGSAAANQGKCWDSASNSIMDKSAHQNQASSGARNPGGGAAGSSPSGSTTGSAIQMRPAEAARLPSC